MIKRIDKPWGKEEVWADTENYIGKILTILPRQMLSLQYHKYKQETIYVLSGVLRYWNSENNKEYQDLKAGSVVQIEPNQLHRFGCATDESTILIEVSTQHKDDIVRLKDIYNRLK